MTTTPFRLSRPAMLPACLLLLLAAAPLVAAQEPGTSTTPTCSSSIQPGLGLTLRCRGLQSFSAINAFIQASNSSFKGISVRNSNIGTLGPITGLSTVKALSMRQCNITQITSGIFVGASIQDLDLSFNSLKEITADMVAGLDNLATLFLRNNAISSITAGALSTLTALSELDLSSNSLTFLPPLTSNKRLKILVLQSNQLTEMPNVTSPILSTMILTNNSIVYIPKGIFEPYMSTFALLVTIGNPSQCGLGFDVNGSTHIVCWCQIPFFGIDYCIPVVPNAFQFNSALGSVTPCVPYGLTELAKPQFEDLCNSTGTGSKCCQVFNSTYNNNTNTYSGKVIFSANTSLSTDLTKNCDATPISSCAEFACSNPTCHLLPSFFPKWVSYLNTPFLPTQVQNQRVTAVRAQLFPLYHLPAPNINVGNGIYLIYFTVDSLPLGLFLENTTGLVYGAPLASGVTSTQAFAYDFYSGQEVFLGVVTFDIRVCDPLRCLNGGVCADPYQSTACDCSRATGIGPTCAVIVSTSSNDSTPIIIATLTVTIGIAVLCYGAFRLYQKYDKRKVFHVFISYRVATDIKTAQFVYKQLQDRFLSTGHRVRVFWDKECLARGIDWEKDFRRGLKRSCLYLPLLSDAGLDRIRTITPTSRVDNFLLEMELALWHAKRGHLVILPVTLGRVDERGEFVKFSTYKTDSFPATPSPTRARGTVRRTMDKLFRKNALSVRTPLPTKEDIDEIVHVLEKAAWGSEKDSLQLHRLWVSDEDYEQYTLMGSSVGAGTEDAQPNSSALTETVQRWAAESIAALEGGPLPAHLSRREYEKRLYRVVNELALLQGELRVPECCHRNWAARIAAFFSSPKSRATGYDIELQARLLGEQTRPLPP